MTLNSKLPKTPEWSFNVGPRFETPLGNGGRVVFNLDYAYRSSVYNDSENTPLLRRPSTDNLNASLMYSSPDDRWDFIFGGTNLTDDRYVTTGQAQLGGGQIYGTYNPPRQWYATIRLRGN